eukprot:9764722-Lingulodinium_polyedra.AAC.1
MTRTAWPPQVPDHQAQVTELARELLRQEGRIQVGSHRRQGAPPDTLGPLASPLVAILGLHTR